MSERSRSAGAKDPSRNADCPWDSSFDSDAYLEHNYGTLHHVDRKIIKVVGEFFELVQQQGTGPLNGVDVGPGPNLYPAYSMLPVTKSITFWEYSARNVAWLSRTLGPTGRPGDEPWNRFWELLAESSPAYRQIANPGEELKRQARRPVKGSIFELPYDRWEVGSMFFVAESITARMDEFDLATERFLRSLRVGAPFVAAFMRNSEGYSAGKQEFPAVGVGESDVHRALHNLATDFKVHSLDSAEIRSGYDGVLLVTGHRSTVAGNPAGEQRVLDHAGVGSVAGARIR